MLDDKGRSSFSLIQPRISVADPNTIAHLSRSTPVTLFLFDLLYLDGYDLRGVPLEERKRLLGNRLTPVRSHPPLRPSSPPTATRCSKPRAPMDSKASSPSARDSKYEGRRSRDWIKIKVVTTGDFVIGGFTHGERDYFSSLVLGLYDHGKLMHVGPGRHRLQREIAERDLREARAAHHEEEPVHRDRSKRCATSPG